MNWSELIDRLAALAGLEPWYFDIQGRRHETTLAAKVLVLNAVGLDVSSIAAARSSIAAMEEENWRSVIPPFIIRDEVSGAIDLFLPASGSGGTWTCEITLESGEEKRSEFRPQQLALLGVREIDGVKVEHRRLESTPLPPGYHRVRIASNESTETSLASVPTRCYLPDAFASPGARQWGVSTHLYTLRSERNWGSGDFGDLATLAQLAGEAGASALALNPFHALFPAFPDEASPYSPSSRLFLNPLYIDAASAPFAGACPEIAESKASLAQTREARFVDYPGVWHAKRAAFEALFLAFQDEAPQSPLADEYAAFLKERGAELDSFAAFAALEERHGRPWMQWPKEFRSPKSQAVKTFARENAQRINLHRYLQFLADRQLHSAAKSAHRSGMNIGLVRDLAIGISPDGADAWAQQDAFVFGLRCGAPPDEFQPRGQEWGVLPLNPLTLKRDFAPFVSLLRANMRHAGGLRIDHVIGLQRMFLVPLGGDATGGCYVRYPFEELLGLLALESHRNEALIVGEDLGTVPEGFRGRMHEKNILGCAILYFERNRDGNFKAPRDYRSAAAVSAATHDLPTLAGYWEGRDIKERRRIGIYDDAEADAAWKERRRDCALLCDALREAGFGIDECPDELTSALRDAIHGFLASSTAQLFLAQLDDLAGEKDAINIPGTVAEYPNWRRKLARALEDPALGEALRELGRIAAERGRG